MWDLIKWKRLCLKVQSTINNNHLKRKHILLPASVLLSYLKVYRSTGRRILGGTRLLSIWKDIQNTCWASCHPSLNSDKWKIKGGCPFKSYPGAWWVKHSLHSFNWQVLRSRRHQNRKQRNCGVFFFHKVIWIPPLSWWQYLLQVLLPHIGLGVPQIYSTFYSLNLEQTSLWDLGSLKTAK